MSRNRFALAIVLTLAACIGTAHAGSKQRPTLPRKSEDAMSLRRIALHAVRIGLLVLLILQSLQMASALQMLDGPEAFEVSPYLLAALVFKSILLFANLGLLCLAQYAVRRSRPVPPSPALRPTFNGESS